MKTKMNHLSNQKSSYLKSAVNQPVNWYPWSKEVFELAKKEDKPILLDIGASWCHWCHVIDEESYENKETSEIINKNFIAIKVDRDERPDIDRIYQEAGAMLSGQGGWPLTVFLTPEKIPFYAGTYFPPEDRFGLPSFKKVLLHASKIYKENKDNIKHITSQILKSLKEEKVLSEKKPTLEILKKANLQILNLIDPINGGFGSKPKFPNTEALLFLLTMYAESGDKESLEGVNLTLRKMAEGGIYDQLAGGFHRYSTDEEWKIPHFEKLLIDNALLLEAYVITYNYTRDGFFKKIAAEIISFIKNEIYDKDGFFYASQDADVDEEEGLYFTWTKDEIDKVLNEEESKIISWHYGIEDIGEVGKYKVVKVKDRNVLYVENQPEAIAEVLAKDMDKILQIIKKSNKKLFEIREKRKKPFVDKTLFTNWNAVMINSLFDAYNILDDEKYKEMAVKALDFIIDKLFIKNKLFHMYSEGEYLVEGFLDDYQFLIQALINAFEVTSNEKYLEFAIKLNDIAIKNFWDDSLGGFFYAHKSSELLRNDKPYMDLSMPSGNSIAVVNLIKLQALTDKDDYLKKAEKILRIFSDRDDVFLYKASYYIALNLFLNGVILIKVLESENGAEEVLRHIYSMKNNRKFVQFYKKGQQPKGLKLVNNKTTIYVCQKGSCSKPITGIKELEKLKLGSNS